MCGIAGFFNSENASEKTRETLEAIGHRGTDGCGMATQERVSFASTPAGLKADKNSKAENAIGHLLHSVVGMVKQPLKKTGLLVANCEIYNWKELCKKHSLRTKNDAELLLKLLDKACLDGQGMLKALDELDGVWAFAYWRSSKVVLSRDILGEKPLWYSLENGLCFASEKKALESTGCAGIAELSPRHTMVYDIEKDSAGFFKREFFPQRREKANFEESKKKLLSLLECAVRKRVPEKKLGLLFSGGVDSVLLAALLKRLGLRFKCYFGFVRGIGKPKDLEFAEKAAKELGLELETVSVGMDELPELIRETVHLIESSDPVRVGVGLPLYLACREAKKDGIKVMFSGLGADELFCGYARFRNSNDVALDSKNLLLQMHENDLYRDDLIAMKNGMEMRLPFLDNQLVGFALSLPKEFKISGERNKIVLRECAAILGIGRGFAERGKKAAQYGSNFDKAIEKLAKKAKAVGVAAGKAAYLKSFAAKENMKLAALFSGGKDSCLAAWIMQRQNYDVSCLVSVLPENPDSFMYHKPDSGVLKLQAEALEIPLIAEKTKGEKERELHALKKALLRAKKEFGVRGVVSGALYSNYQRERIQKICNDLQLRMFAPLWHKKQQDELRELAGSGFEFIISKIAAGGLGMEWLGKRIGKGEAGELIALAEKHGFNAAGEGGEYETLVLDAPNFRKKLCIEFEKSPEGEHKGSIRARKAWLCEK